ncbi:MAG: glycosyltransferase family 4 protein [Pseudomonadota bacterium]
MPELKAPPFGKRLRILTWHVHGNYLYYLTQVPHDFYLVHDDERSTHHSGRIGNLPWGDNVHEVHVDEVAKQSFDVVLFQSRDAWQTHQHRYLSAAQRRLPRIYLEHDTPFDSPTDSRHWMDDPQVLLVHVTHYNALMWDTGPVPTRVVEHGVRLLEGVQYSGVDPRGVVVVNNLDRRGRRVGHDVFQSVAQEVPLVLIGMGSDRVPGGHGEVENNALPKTMAAFRFFFNPIRYTSLGLAVIEAMMCGLPIVGLATTELVTVIRNGQEGFLDTRLDTLKDTMRQLIANPGLARHWGEAARRTALERFAIERFVDDWLRTFNEVTG